MEYTDRLNARIDAYIATVQELLSKKGAFDGIFGLGHHPKNDPCHSVFYEDVVKLVSECVESSPSSEEADSLAETLLKADSVRGDLPEVQMMYIPLQGQIIPLIPFMSEAKKKELGEWYAQAVPKRMRLPVQKNACKALGVK
ncbi:MAG: hypothetical protein Q4F31_06030 [Eubacteriales bacterium]|nr:hypothetical protein [Eubacteriales bacterium]